MLNTFTGTFGYPPTKVRIFKVERGNNPIEVIAEEVISKGACTKKLRDYGISDESKFFIAHYSDAETKFVTSVKSLIRQVMKAEICTLLNSDEPAPEKTPEAFTQGSLLNHVRDDYIPQAN